MPPGKPILSLGEHNEICNLAECFIFILPVNKIWLKKWNKMQSKQ